MPGTVLSSGDMRKKRCNLCFHTAYSLKVETDMQKKYVQYNTVKCFHGGIYKVQWELGRGGRTLAQRNQDSITEEVATKLRLNLQCGQAGKGNDRCKDREYHGGTLRDQVMQFSLSQRCSGEGGRMS